MSYIFHGVFLGLLFFLVANYNRGDHSKWIFYLALLLRLLAGLGVGYIFFNYYDGADTLYYYKLADDFNKSIDKGIVNYLVSFFQPIDSLSMEPRTQFFVKIIGPVALFTPDYWILSLYLSFGGFLGSWYFVRKMTLLVPDAKPVIYYAFLFFPSVIFWSSGVLKDTVANLAMLVSLGVFLGHFNGIRPKLWEWMALLMGILVLIEIRFYAAGFLLICMMMLGMDKVLDGKKLRWKLIAFSLVLLTGFLSMQLLHTWMRPERLPLTLYDNHMMILEKSNVDDVIRFDNFEPTYGSLLRQMPLASLSGLFRPLPWEHQQVISLVIRLENIFLIFFSLVSLVMMRTKWLTSQVLTGLFLIFVLSGLLAISTPNFGTLSRYRTIYLPHYVMLISLIPYRKFFSKKEVN